MNLATHCCLPRRVRALLLHQRLLALRPRVVDLLERAVQRVAVELRVLPRALLDLAPHGRTTQHTLAQRQQNGQQLRALRDGNATPRVVRSRAVRRFRRVGNVERALVAESLQDGPDLRRTVSRAGVLDAVLESLCARRRLSTTGDDGKTMTCLAVRAFVLDGDEVEQCHNNCFHRRIGESVEVVEGVHVRLCDTHERPESQDELAQLRAAFSDR